MEIRIKQYEEEDTKEAVGIWNQVVEDGEAAELEAAALLLGPQRESSDPAEFERPQALGPVAALRTRPLRPGEAVDAAVDAPGGFPPALETLAWLLFDDALTLEHVGRHAAHVWAKTARFAPRGAPSGTAR